MASSEFTYFGVLIFFVLILYTIILAVFLCIRRHNIKKALEYRSVVRGTNDAQQDFYDEANFSFEFRTDFDAVTQSALGKGCKFFLFASRLTAFAFFFATSVLLNLVKNNNGLFYFTNWNSLLVTIYYATAAAASFLGIYAKAQRSEYGFSIGAGIRWSYWVRCLGVAVHSLFEVAGATSMFVMVFDFFYEREDDPDMISLLNFTRALTVVALTFELFLNNINVRFDQYPANIAWTMAYLMFVWPAVFTGVMDGWPYALLQTQTDMCFPYYFLLVLLNFGFYVLWWIIYKTKKAIYIHYNIGRVGSNYWEGEQEVPHEFMLLERTMNPLSSHGGGGLGQGGFRDMGGATFYDDPYSSTADAFAVEGFPADDYEGHYDEGEVYDPQAFYGADVYGDGTMNGMYDPRMQYPGYDQYGQPYPVEPSGYDADGNPVYPDPQQYPYPYPPMMDPAQFQQYQYQQQQQHGQQYGYDPQAQVPYLDEYGNPYTDEYGNPLFLPPPQQPYMDEYGNPYTDEYGNPLYLPPPPQQPYMDEYGNPYGAEDESTYSSPYSYQQHPSPYLYPNTGYPDPQAGGGEFNQDRPWEAPYPSPQFAGAWDYDGIPPGSFPAVGGGAGRGGAGRRGAGVRIAGPSQTAANDESVTGATTVAESPEKHDDTAGTTSSAAALPRTLPPKPFEGSLLDRGRSGRGAGRLGGRGVGGRTGGRIGSASGGAATATGDSSSKEGPRFLSSTELPAPPALPKKPIHVTAHALDGADYYEGDLEAEGLGFDNSTGDGGEGEGAADGGFDYSGVGAWGSFKASGYIPHTAAEAGVSKRKTQPVVSSNSSTGGGGAGGGFLSFFGFGSKPVENTSATTTSAYGAAGQGARAKKAGWFDSAADDDNDDDEQEFDEEHTFGDATAGAGAGMDMDASRHATGAFIAKIAGKDAFHAPSSLVNPRRKSGDATRLINTGAGVGVGEAKNRNSPSGPNSGMFRPPSVPKLFRTSSREGNNEGGRRPLTLQKLGSQPSSPMKESPSAGAGGGSWMGSLTPKSSFTSTASPMLRPPSLSRILRSSSRENLNPGSRTLNLQPLPRSASGAKMLPRKASMEKGSFSPTDEGAMFDYSEMDAWASFRATGAMPHNPEEAGVTLNKLGADGFEVQKPPSILKGGAHKTHAGGGGSGGGWFDSVEEDSSDNEIHSDDAKESHLLEESDLEAITSSIATHKTGTYIASSAKKEAFHTPASLAAARRKSVNHAAGGAGKPNLPPPPPPSPQDSSSPRSQQSPQQAQAGGMMFKPPSMPRMFRAGSRGENNSNAMAGPGSRTLNLQKLSADPNRAGSSRALLLSRTASAGGGASRMLPRKASMEYEGGGAVFDYADMNAWASFRATGDMPHNPEEAGVTLNKLGADGFASSPLKPSPAGHKSGQRKSPTSGGGGGWFDSAQDDSSDNDIHSDDAKDSHLLEEADLEAVTSSIATHKTGAYIASSAKKEAFHTPASLAAARRKSVDHSTGTSAPAPVKVNLPPKGSVVGTGAGTGAGATGSGVTGAAGAAGGGSWLGSLTPKSSFTSTASPMFRPPSVPRMFRSSSRERNMPEGRSEVTARKMVSLKPLGANAAGIAGGGSSGAGAGRLTTLGSLNRAGASTTVGTSASSARSPTSTTATPASGGGAGAAAGFVQGLASQGSFFENAAHNGGNSEDFDEEDEDEDDDFRLG